MKSHHMNRINYFLFAFFSFVISVKSYSQAEWELKKEDDGIKVYTREVEGSDIRAFKAEAIMDGKLSAFVGVLQDIHAYTDWFSNVAEVQLIEINDTFHVHSSVTSAPWPVSDRYGVFSNTYSQRYDHKTVTVKVKALDGYIGEMDGKVRILDATGSWTFHPVGYNKVEVTFTMHAEPGGNIPNWVANMFLVDGPMKDFKNLREQVALPQYQNKKFEFLVEY
jgi:hypothetical protein